MVTRFHGASWCDVTRDGRIVALVGTEIQTWVEGVVSVVAQAPEPLLYLRADVSGRGAVALVGQGNHTGDAWCWAAGQWRNLGPCGGQNAVEIVGDGLGWLVWLQVAADRYELLTLGTDGTVIARVPHAMPWTSQGFLDATDPELLFTDAGRVVGGLMLPNLAGRYLVGQDPHAERLLLGDMAGTPLRVLAEGLCFEPRAAWIGDGQVVACSRSDARGALVVRGRPEDFPVWTPVVTPPEPPRPPVEPPTGGQTMWTQAHADVLRQFVAKFPCPGGPGQDEAARAWTRQAAEQFAFTFPREGWGHKRADSGRPPSTDVIATRSPFQGYDLILSQGRADWAVNYRPSPEPLPGQVYIEVAPTNHLGVPVEPPPDPVDPLPPPAGDVEARLRALESWRVDVAKFVVRTATEWPR